MHWFDYHCVRACQLASCCLHLQLADLAGHCCWQRWQRLATTMTMACVDCLHHYMVLLLTTLHVCWQLLASNCKTRGGTFANTCQQLCTLARIHTLGCSNSTTAVRTDDCQPGRPDMPRCAAIVSVVQLRALTSAPPNLSPSLAVSLGTCLSMPETGSAAGPQD